MTTSTSSANARALPSNRRGFIASLVAAGLLTGTAALAAPDGAVHPDAELLALDAQLAEAVAFRHELAERADAAYERHQDPPLADALFWRQSDAWMVWSNPERLDGVGDPDGGTERYTYASEGVAKKLRARLATWKAAPSVPGSSRDEEIARVEEIIAGVEAWEAERDRRLAACGYTAAEEAHDAQSEVIDALWHSIAVTPARTAEGVCVKARAAMEASIGDVAFVEEYLLAPLLAKADRGSVGTAKMLSLSAMVDAAKLGAASSGDRRAA